MTVNMAATNAQGSPTQFLLNRDGTTTLSNQSVSGTTATFAWDTTAGGLANGTHTLDLTVTDAAGRTATASVTVTVTAPPALTAAITSPTNGSAVTGTVTNVVLSLVAKVTVLDADR